MNDIYHHHAISISISLFTNCYHLNLINCNIIAQVFLHLYEYNNVQMSHLLTCSYLNCMIKKYGDNHLFYVKSFNFTSLFTTPQHKLVSTHISRTITEFGGTYKISKCGHAHYYFKNNQLSVITLPQCDWLLNRQPMKCGAKGQYANYVQKHVCTQNSAKIILISC